VAAGQPIGTAGADRSANAGALQWAIQLTDIKTASAGRML